MRLERLPAVAHETTDRRVTRKWQLVTTAFAGVQRRTFAGQLAVASLGRLIGFFGAVIFFSEVIFFGEAVSLRVAFPRALTRGAVLRGVMFLRVVFLRPVLPDEVFRRGLFRAAGLRVAVPRRAAIFGSPSYRSSRAPRLRSRSSRTGLLGRTTCTTRSHLSPIGRSYNDLKTKER